MRLSPPTSDCPLRTSGSSHGAAARARAVPVCASPCGPTAPGGRAACPAMATAPATWAAFIWPDNGHN
ncbi:hypothetical protein IWW55_002260 [Coemansia sp. RSA 2706]|nr:hypothetical protein IWW55_002260 [Coemansia sp. RSA 2706]